MRVEDLVIALVEGVEPAEGEQHHGHEERVDVALSGVAERMQR